VGFRVDDFDATRTRMVEAGIAFVGEPQRAGGAIWNHFVAPDGNVYEIIGADRDDAS
jgi:predicted enzyme related to lactoylglutathione lyase